MNTSVAPPRPNVREFGPTVDRVLAVLTECLMDPDDPLATVTRRGDDLYVLASTGARDRPFRLRLWRGLGGRWRCDWNREPCSRLVEQALADANDELHDLLYRGLRALEDRRQELFAERIKHALTPASRPRSDRGIPANAAHTWGRRVRLLRPDMTDRQIVDAVRAFAADLPAGTTVTLSAKVFWAIFPPAPAPGAGGAPADG